MVKVEVLDLSDSLWVASMHTEGYQMPKYIADGMSVYIPVRADGKVMALKMLVETAHGDSGVLVSEKYNIRRLFDLREMLVRKQEIQTSGT